MDAKERYDAGDFRICVWLDIPAYQQDYTEFHSYELCQNWGFLPVQEGSSKVEGLASSGDFDPQPLAYGGFYGGGLKDW